MGLGTWDSGTWDAGTRDAGTRGRRDVGLGDTGTWGRGDVGTWDSKMLGPGMWHVGTRRRDKQTTPDFCKVQFSVLSRKILYLSFGS